jgi:hypothetical protein
MRWGGFYQGLKKCPNGILVESEEHLREVIMQGGDNRGLKKLADLAVDVFLADLESKNVIHYSPFIVGGETA